VIVRRFARPYAKAIIEVAGSAQKASAVRGELMPFAASLRNSAELQAVYANPGIETDAKLNITKTVARKLKVSELGEKVLEVLVTNQRINDIDSILAALAAYTNEMLGVAVAEVRTAKALTPDEMDQLATVLGKKIGKRVELDVRTDPTLLGGFVAKIGSEIYDASVLRKIDRFRESLA
jgi:F-type H+-transporting ATPase subunit delta